MKRNIIRKVCSLVLMMTLSIPLIAVGHVESPVEPSENHWGIGYVHQAKQWGYLPQSAQAAETMTWTKLKSLIGASLCLGLVEVEDCFPKGIKVKDEEKAVSRFQAADVLWNTAEKYGLAYEATSTSEKIIVQIGDFEEIPNQYRRQVVFLYAIGASCGMDGAGRFCGESVLTTAQASVMVLAVEKYFTGRLGSIDLECTMWRGMPTDRAYTGLWCCSQSLWDIEPEEQVVMLDVPAFPDGSWATLTWPGLELLCFRNKHGEQSVQKLRTTDPTFTTIRGIGVGTSVEELMAAYSGRVYEGGKSGEFYANLLWYGGTFAPKLVFETNGQTITAVSMKYMYPPEHIK